MSVEPRAPEGVDPNEDMLVFCDRYAISLFDHQREAARVAFRRVDGRFEHQLAGVCWGRGNGKTHFAATFGTWCLLAMRSVINVALGIDGARLMLDAVRRIVEASPALSRAVEFTSEGLWVPSTGATWIMRSPSHLQSRGEHRDVVIGDEWGYEYGMETFGSLRASQASVPDPHMLLISTVGGRKAGPLWTVKRLAEGGTEGVHWEHRTDNPSPLVTYAFLQQQRAVLMPAAYQREHQNVWTEGESSFATDAQVRAAEGGVEAHVGEAGVAYVLAVDVGLVSDPSVLTVAHLAGDTVAVDSITVMQGSRSNPVAISAIEATVVDLCSRFAVARCQIESWQGLASVERLQGLGLPIETYVPTSKSHSEQWPILAQRLSAATVKWPTNETLRQELLNLSYEITRSGVKVSDRAAGIHQDIATTLRMVTAMLHSEQKMCPNCGEAWSKCSNAHVWGGGGPVDTSVSLEQKVLAGGGVWFPGMG